MAEPRGGIAGGVSPSRRSRARTAFGNALFGMADYIVQPAAMLVAAPTLIRHLGVAQYGLWMLVMAAVAGAGLIGTGFGGASIKYVSLHRGRNDWNGVSEVVRSAIAVNLFLGVILAAAVWFTAPFAVYHFFKIDAHLQDAAVRCLRIGSAVLVLRSVESVFASTLRGFEKYGPTLFVNTTSRVSSVALAVILAVRGKGIVAIMNALLVIAATALLLHILAVRRKVGPVPLLPRITRSSSGLVSFGCFSWLQTVAGVAFSHGDRLLVGAMLGTSAVAYYAICVQAAQTVHGLVSATFNFIFPYVSFKHAAGHRSALPRAFLLGLAASVALTIVLVSPFVFGSNWILSHWMGREFAAQTHVLLSVLAIAFGILAISVVPHYVLLAMGKVRFVSAVNVAAVITGLLAAIVLIPKMGLLGAAMGRMVCGPVVALNFVAVYRNLKAESREVTPRC